jgi:hypothetical protein
MKYFWVVVSLLFVNAAQAQTLTVREVRISVKADSAATAREQALDQAYTRAFQKLIQEYFPEQMVSPPSQDVLINMVNDFSIDREKTTPTSYAASLTFQFDESKVRDWFQHTHSVQHKGSPNVPSYGQENLLTIEATYETHKEWLHLKKALKECTGVQHISVVSLSPHATTLEMRYTGPLTQLENALFQKNILLTQQGDHWMVTLNK